MTFTQQYITVPGHPGIFTLRVSDFLTRTSVGCGLFLYFSPYIDVGFDVPPPPLDDAMLPNLKWGGFSLDAGGGIDDPTGDILAEFNVSASAAPTLVNPHSFFGGILDAFHASGVSPCIAGTRLAPDFTVRLESEPTQPGETAEWPDIWSDSSAGFYFWPTRGHGTGRASQPGGFAGSSYQVDLSGSGLFTDFSPSFGCGYNTMRVRAFVFGNMSAGDFVDVTIESLSVTLHLVEVSIDRCTGVETGITPVCTYSVTPTTFDLPCAAGGGTICVTSSLPACDWGAYPNDPWITITSPNAMFTVGGMSVPGIQGFGNGCFAFTVSANTGATRIGTIQTTGGLVTITQHTCGGGGGGAVSGPFNLATRDGQYHRAKTVAMGGMRYYRDHTPTPQGGFLDVNGAAITSNMADSAFRMCEDNRHILYGVFTRPNGGASVTDAWMTTSADGGNHWETPVMAIAGGKHPTIKEGKNGGIIRAAFVLVSGHTYGTIQATYQAPGDSAPGAQFPFNYLASGTVTAMLFQDDSFHIDNIGEGADRWILTCLINGETDVSEWTSATDGMFWERVV